MSEGNGHANGNGTAVPQKHAPGASPASGVVPPVEHRWKPGVSANPGGLPKGTKQVRKRLRNELIRYLRDNPSKRKEIVAGLVDGCVAGDAACQRIAWDRVDGVLEKTVNVNARMIAKVIVRGE